MAFTWITHWFLSPQNAETGLIIPARQKKTGGSVKLALLQKRIQILLNQ